MMMAVMSKATLENRCQVDVGNANAAVSYNITSCNVIYNHSVVS